MYNRTSRSFFNAPTLLLALLSAGCGYSKEEYGQKVREIETLRNQLTAQQQQRKKCEADYADSLHEIDELKRKLQERGLTLETLNDDLAEQRKALEEYQTRLDQLNEVRKRFELLRQKLQALTSLGLTVEVRDNRMLIQLPGNVLFGSGSDHLKEDGEAILRQVAEVVRSDADLNQREFQVAGHTDANPLKNAQFKDNWGLSAMRARSVVVFLTRPVEEGGGGLNPRNWSAAGYGDTDPVAGNDTEPGRQTNRRVELVVLPNVEEMLNLNSLLK